MNILMVGCGRMGGAMLNSWAGLEDISFTVVDPAALSLPVGVNHVQHVDDLGMVPFDVVIVAVKPQMIDDVMPAYVSLLRKGGLLASIAAGYSLKNLEAIFDGAAIVRIMPNLPALIGRSATGLFGNSKVTDPHKFLIAELMQAIGRAVWVASEDELDRLTAISGSGPGYVFQFMESFISAAMDLGFTEKDARTLVLQTMAGAADMAIATDKPVSELRKSVTSKGGTTQAGLNELRTGDALDRLMKATTKAAYSRALELQ